MPVIVFLADDGTHTEVHAEAGSSVMSAAIDNGVAGIEAECGGACSCATCHCYIDEPWQSLVVAPGELEKDMLDCVVEPQRNSRLSCQVIMTDELDGLVVQLPASQY